jgi:hypothetical protein
MFAIPWFLITTLTSVKPVSTGDLGKAKEITPPSFAGGLNSLTPTSGVVALRVFPSISAATQVFGLPILLNGIVVNRRLLILVKLGFKNIELEYLRNSESFIPKENLTLNNNYTIYTNGQLHQIGSFYFTGNGYRSGKYIINDLYTCYIFFFQFFTNEKQN